METRISFPSGAVGPGMTPPFLVASMRPGQGGVTGYGDINVSAMPNNQRVGPVRSPIGPVNGYRDQTRPLGPVAYVPSNIPGPIFPGVGPGSWHVGPTIMRDGRLPFGTYSARTRRKDAHFQTYGAAYGADAGKAALGVAGLGLIAGIVLLPTLVVGPFIVKAFAPNWSYGRRLGASMAFGLVTSVLVNVMKAARAPEAAK